METLILVGVLVATDTTTSSSSLLGLIFAVLSAGFVGALISFLTIRSTMRTKHAEADRAEVEVDRVEASVEQIKTGLIKQVLEAADAEFGRMRETVEEERTRAAQAILGQAEAQAALAKTQAELASALEQARKERHDLVNDIASRDAEIALLKRQVAELQDELKTLRAQLDTEHHGRRHGDGTP